MQGSIQKRTGANGTSYRLRVDAGIVDGKRRVLSRTVKAAKPKDAHNALRDFIREVEAGAATDRRPGTVGDLLDRWIAANKSTVRVHTAETYQWLMNRYVRPALGDAKIADVTGERIQSLYTALIDHGGQGGKPLSRRTVHHVHRTLKLAFSWAVRSRIIARNPCDEVRAPRWERKEVSTLTPGQVQEVLGFIENRSPWAIPIVKLALFTGARRGEVIALQMGDLNLDGAAPSVAIRRSAIQTSDQQVIIQSPKTQKAVRSIALSALGVQVLQGQLEHRRREADMLGVTLGPADYVFAAADGSLPKPASVSQVVRRACREAGIDHGHFHSLRHTHATWLLQTGAHPKVAQERLGHSTVMLTIDTYSHVIPGLQERAAQAVDAVFLNGRSLPAGN